MDGIGPKSLNREHKRASMTRRRRRYRARRKAGRMVVPEELDLSTLALLIEHRIATEAQVDAPCTQEGRLGDAIGAFFTRNAP
jgi:hypothetical protein